MSPSLSPRAVTEEHEYDGHTRGKNPNWFNEHLLPRDRHRCAFTNKPDLRSNHWRNVDSPLHRKGGAFLMVAHVINQPLTGGISGLPEGVQSKLQWASSPAAILDHFAGIEVQGILDNLEVHHPANTMMLDHSALVWFNQLRTWLSPIQDDEGNDYGDTYHLNLQDPDFFTFGPGFIHQVQFHRYTTPD